MDVRTQMRSAAGHYAGRTAIVAGDRRLSFAQAWARGLRMANALLALGKIKRKELREPYWAGHARRVAGS